jgi:hypothetical protein
MLDHRPGLRTALAAVLILAATSYAYDETTLSGSVEAYLDDPAEPVAAVARRARSPGPLT